MVRAFGKHCEMNYDFRPHRNYVPLQTVEKVGYCGIAGITIKGRDFWVIMNGSNDFLTHKRVGGKGEFEQQDAEPNGQLEEHKE